MSLRPPFRIHIEDAPPTDREGQMAYMRAVRFALAPEKASSHTLLEAARFPSEFVALALITNHVGLRYPARTHGSTPEPEMRDALVRFALERARTEGVVWTPLIDALVESGFWMLAREEQRARGDECDRTIPQSDELASGLTEWIRAQQDTSELEALLEFQASPVGAVLASHAARVDEDLICRVSERAPGALPRLAENPSLDAETRAHLALWAWDHVIAARSRERSYTKQDERPFDTWAALECFQMLCRHPEGVSAAVKEEFLESQERREPEDRLHGFLAALLADATLTPEEFDRIADVISGVESVHVLVDPRCSETVQREILARDGSTRLAERVFEHPGASASLLRATYESCDSTRDTRTALLRHPHCPDDLVRELLPTFVLPDENAATWLLKLPRYIQSTEYRAMFRRCRHASVLERLLEVSPPEEFVETFLLYYRSHRERALASLQNDELLGSLALTHADLLPLLSHEDSNVRLSTIRILSRLQQEGGETALERAQGTQPERGPAQPARSEVSAVGRMN
jgi:hypothetical protein